MNVGVSCTAKRSDVMNNQVSYSSPHIVPRRLVEGNPLGLTPTSTPLSRQTLIKEALDIVGASPLTTANSAAVARSRRGSLRTPTQVNELLLDNSNRLDFFMQNYYQKGVIVDDFSDDESDIDE